MVMHFDIQDINPFRNDSLVVCNDLQNPGSAILDSSRTKSLSWRLFFSNSVIFLYILVQEVPSRVVTLTFIGALDW